MDFDFSDDQEQLRDAVRKWVDKGYDFERRRAIVAAGGFDRAAYGELAELGLTGLYVPEDHGGMGMGPVEGMVVMEELGRGIVLEPLAQALIAGAVLAGYAPDAVKADWLRQSGLWRRAGGAGAHRARQPLSNSTPARPAPPKQAARGPSRARRAWCRSVTRPTPSWCRPMVNGKMALFLVERTGQRRDRHRLRHPGRQPRRPRCRSTTRPPPSSPWTARPRWNTRWTSASPPPAPKRWA